MPSIRQTIFTGLSLAVIGWGGLVYLFFFTLPTLGPRWLFFFFLMLALTGSALPIVAFLNRRFQLPSQIDAGVIIRQSIWVGIYGNLLAWFQLGRILTMALVLFLAVGFVLIEFLLRLRENSLWSPKERNRE